MVQVRSQPALDQRDSYPERAAAERHLDALIGQGHKTKLVQLETAFKLCVRRQGLPSQYTTFDSWEQAEQARLQIVANLSVSIVRDYAVAARTTLRELMTRYREEVVPAHKGAAIERNRINRMLRDEDFVDKKLAALCPGDAKSATTFKDLLSGR